MKRINMHGYEAIITFDERESIWTVCMIDDLRSPDKLSVSEYMEFLALVDKVLKDHNTVWRG